MEEKLWLILAGFACFINGSLSATYTLKKRVQPQFHISQHGDRSSFLGAISNCFSIQMAPISLGSAEEEAELIQQLNQYHSKQPGNPVQEFWLGGTNLGHESADLYWMHSDTPFGYNNFGQGPTTQGRCIKLVHSRLRIRWAMEKCSKELRYICKPVDSTTWNQVQVRSIFDNISDTLHSLWARMNTVAEWIKGKLVATQEFTVPELKTVVDTVQETLGAANATEAEDTNLVDIIKDHQNAIAERLRKTLRWNEEKIKHALKWAVDTFTHSVDHAKKTLYWVTNGLQNAANLNGEQIKKVVEAVKQTIVATKSQIGPSAKDAAKWMQENKNLLATKLKDVLATTGKNVKQVLDEAVEKVFHPGMAVYDFSAWVTDLLNRAQTFTEDEIKKVIDVVEDTMVENGVQEVDANTISKWISQQRPVITERLTSTLDWAKDKVQQVIEIISAPLPVVGESLKNLEKWLLQSLQSTKQFSEGEINKVSSLLLDEVKKAHSNAVITMQTISTFLQTNIDRLKTLLSSQLQWTEDKVKKAMDAISSSLISDDPVLKFMKLEDLYEDDRSAIGDVQDWIRQSLQNAFQYTDLETYKMTAAIMSELIKVLPVRDISLENAQFYIKNHLYEFIPIVGENMRWNFDKASKPLVQLVADTRSAQGRSGLGDARIKRWLRQTLKALADLSEDDVLKLVEIIVEQLNREHPFGGITIHTAANWIKDNFDKLTPLFINAMSWNQQRAEKAVTDVTYVIVQRHPDRENRDDQYDSIESVNAWIRMVLRDAFTRSGLSAEEMSKVTAMILDELIKEHPMGDITIHTAANWLRHNLSNLMQLIRTRMRWNQSKADRTISDVTYVIIQRHPDNNERQRSTNNEKYAAETRSVTAGVDRVFYDAFKEVGISEAEILRANDLVLKQLIQDHPKQDITTDLADRWMKKNKDTLRTLLARGMGWNNKKTERAVDALTILVGFNDDVPSKRSRKRWHHKGNQNDFLAPSVKDWIKTILTNLGDNISEEQAFRLTTRIVEQLLKERPHDEITVDTAADWMKNNADTLESILSRSLSWNKHQVQQAVNKVTYVMVNQNSPSGQPGEAWNNEKDKLEFTFEKIRLWIRRALQNIAELTDEESDKVTALIMDELTKEYPLGDITAQRVANWVHSNIGNLISIISRQLRWNERKSHNVVKKVKYVIVSQSPNGEDIQQKDEFEAISNQYDANIIRVKLWIRKLLMETIPNLAEEEIVKLTALIIQEVLKENPLEEINVSSAENWIRNNLAKLASIINRDLRWNRRKTENVIGKVTVIIKSDESDDKEQLYPDSTYDLRLEKVKRWVRSLLRNVPDLSDDQIDQLTLLIIQELRRDRPLEELTAEGVQKWIRRNMAILVPIFSRGMNWSTQRAEQTLTKITYVVIDEESDLLPLEPEWPENNGNNPDQNTVKRWIRRLLENVPELTDSDIAELTVLIIRQMKKDNPLEEITTESARIWIKANIDRFISNISRNMKWSSAKSEKVIRKITYIIIEDDSNSDQPEDSWSNINDDDNDLEAEDVKKWLRQKLMEISDLTSSDADRLTIMIVDELKMEQHFREITVETLVNWMRNNIDQLIPLVSRGLNWNPQKAERLVNKLYIIIKRPRNNWNDNSDNLGKNFENIKIYIRQALENVADLTDKDIVKVTTIIVEELIKEYPLGDIPLKAVADWMRINIGKLVALLSRSMSWNAQKAEKTVDKVTYIIVNESENNERPIDQDDNSNRQVIRKMEKWLLSALRQAANLPEGEIDQVISLIIDELMQAHPHRVFTLEQAMLWFKANINRILLNCGRLMKWSRAKTSEIVLVMTTAVHGTLMSQEPSTDIEWIPSSFRPDSSSSDSLTGWLFDALSQAASFTADEVEKATTIITQQLQKQLPTKELSIYDAADWVKQNAHQLVPILSTGMNWNPQQAEQVVKVVTYTTINRPRGRNSEVADAKDE